MYICNFVCHDNHNTNTPNSKLCHTSICSSHNKCSFWCKSRNRGCKFATHLFQAFSILSLSHARQIFSPGWPHSGLGLFWFAKLIDSVSVLWFWVSEAFETHFSIKISIILLLNDTLYIHKSSLYVNFQIHHRFTVNCYFWENKSKYRITTPVKEGSKVVVRVYNREVFRILRLVLQSFPCYFTRLLNREHYLM